MILVSWHPECWSCRYVLSHLESSVFLLFWNFIIINEHGPILFTILVTWLSSMWKFGAISYKVSFSFPNFFHLYCSPGTLSSSHGIWKASVDHLQFPNPFTLLPPIGPRPTCRASRPLPSVLAGIIFIASRILKFLPHLPIYNCVCTLLHTSRKENSISADFFRSPLISTLSTRTTEVFYIIISKVLFLQFLPPHNTGLRKLSNTKY